MYKQQQIKQPNNNNNDDDDSSNNNTWPRHTIMDIAVEKNGLLVIAHTGALDPISVFSESIQRNLSRTITYNTYQMDTTSNQRTRKRKET